MSTLHTDVDRIVTDRWFRSDRHPAVPFITLEQAMSNAQAAMTPRENPYPSCGASLTTSDITRYCNLRLGHTMTGEEHDWARWL